MALHEFQGYRLRGVGAPAADDDAATKKYVDDNSGNGNGGSMPAPWTADNVTGEVTAAAESGKTPLTIDQADKATPALILQPAAGATIEGDSVLVMNDDAGTPIGDWDASGHMELGYGGHGVALDPTGYVRVNGDPAQIAAGDPLLFVAVLSGGAPLVCVMRGGGRTATIGAGAEGDKVLELNSDESTVDGADVVYVSGAPDYNGGEFRVTAGGAPVVGQVVAPADANLRAGQVAIWFDATNGAAKVKFKGKTADGTVVTGQVALT